MDWHGIAVFAIAYALVVISPGPGLASFVGQILGHGIKAAPAQALGIYAGDLVWYTLAATGLAALANTFAGVFMVMKWLGAAYLLYLAYKMWRSTPHRLDAVADRGPMSHWNLFVSSLMVTLSNPKAIVFYLAVLPAIVDLRHLTIGDYSIGIALIAVILFTILGVYAVAAHAARGFFRSPHAMKMLNRVSGSAIAGAAVVIAARS
ncbi:LysE family translocator [Aestuariivirga sp.]|uniref:LysE family translocator n=1 Tax=Aestuariivirga sp. TaxID=2650926 RepID=UPI0035B25146